TAIQFCGISSNVTIGFWVPAIIQSLGAKSALTIGLLTTIPYGCALISMLLVSRRSDRKLERRYHAALPCAACAAGLIGIGLFAQIPAAAFCALSVAVAGSLAFSPVFWQTPSALLSGTAAAGGIALINSLGSLSGWAGPSIVGWLEDLTGKTSTGLYVVAAVEALAAILILRLLPKGLPGSMQPEAR